MKFSVFIILFFLISINVFSQDNELKLLEAARKGDDKKAFLLIKGGVDVNCETYDGITPLMYAADAGNMYIVKLLIKNGAKVNHIPYNKVTALIAATKSNHPEVVEYLLQNGANVNQKDTKLRSALVYAVAYGYPLTADILCSYNAKVIEKDNFNCFVIAAYFADNEIIKLLLNYDAEIDKKGKLDFTPLMVASQEGHLNTVKLLADTLNCNIETKNIENLRAFDLAVKNGHKDVVDYLISKGAKSNNLIEDNITTYKIARYYGQTEIADKIRNDKKSRKPELGKSSIDFINTIGSFDYLTGLQYTLRESRYLFNFITGILFRPFRKKVFVEQREHYIYQLREFRLSFFAKLNKRFVIYRKGLNEFGIFAGGRFALWLGNYKGTQDKVSPFTISPEAGIFFNGKSIGLKLSYEYADYKTYENNPHKVNFSVLFFINQNPMYYYDRKFDNF